MSDFFEYVILLVIFILFILFLHFYFLDKASCLNGYSDYNPEYSFITGYRIDYNGKLTPINMIKNINLD